MDRDRQQGQQRLGDGRRRAVIQPADVPVPASTNRAYESTKVHRNAQRGNMGLEIGGMALSALSPATEIPFKVSQAALSLFSIFRSGAKLSEQIVHGVQAGLSTAQAALYIVLLYQDNTCEDKSENICITSTVLTLLYGGVLLASAGMAEMSKEPYPPTETENISATII